MLQHSEEFISLKRVVKVRNLNAHAWISMQTYVRYTILRKRCGKKRGKIRVLHGTASEVASCRADSRLLNRLRLFSLAAIKVSSASGTHL